MNNRYIQLLISGVLMSLSCSAISNEVRTKPGVSVTVAAPERRDISIDGAQDSTFFPFYPDVTAPQSLAVPGGEQADDTYIYEESAVGSFPQWFRVAGMVDGADIATVRQLNSGGSYDTFTLLKNGENTDCYSEAATLLGISGGGPFVRCGESRFGTPKTLEISVDFSFGTLELETFVGSCTLYGYITPSGLDFRDGSGDLYFSLEHAGIQRGGTHVQFINGGSIRQLYVGVPAEDSVYFYDFSSSASLGGCADIPRSAAVMGAPRHLQGPPASEFGTYIEQDTGLFVGAPGYASNRGAVFRVLLNQTPSQWDAYWSSRARPGARFVRVARLNSSVTTSDRVLIGQGGAIALARRAVPPLNGGFAMQHELNTVVNWQDLVVVSVTDDAGQNRALLLLGAPSWREHGTVFVFDSRVLTPGVGPSLELIGQIRSPDPRQGGLFGARIVRGVHGVVVSSPGLNASYGVLDPF